MGKRKRRKSSSPLIWKASTGLIRLLAQGLVKSLPVFFFAAIGFGVFWGIRENLYADSGFLLQHLNIAPQNALSPEKVRELEKVYLNQNLFKISPRQVARRVEQDPAIREAWVVREFPNTLRIEIRDRNPFTQIEFSSKGPYYSVDEDGVVLGQAPGRNKNLLLIEVFEDGISKPEQGAGLSIPGFEQAVALVRAFPKQRLSHSETIDRVRLDHLGNVALVLTKGPELRFGREPLKKLRMLNSLVPLLKGPERDRIIYIELQYQDLIVKKK